MPDKHLELSGIWYLFGYRRKFRLSGILPFHKGAKTDKSESKQQHVERLGKSMLNYILGVCNPCGGAHAKQQDRDQSDCR